MNLTDWAIHAVRSPVDLQRRQLPILRLVGIGSDRAEIAARIQPLLYGARPWGPADCLLRDFPACQNENAARRRSAQASGSLPDQGGAIRNRSFAQPPASVV